MEKSCYQLAILWALNAINKHTGTKYHQFVLSIRLKVCFIHSKSKIKSDEWRKVGTQQKTIDIITHTHRCTHAVFTWTTQSDF